MSRYSACSRDRSSQGEQCELSAAGADRVSSGVSQPKQISETRAQLEPGPQKLSTRMPVLKRVSHSARAIDVIMIAEDCETTERRFEPREDCRDRARRYTAAAERLHVDVVAAVQDKVGRERRNIVDDRVEADHIVRMRAGVKIG